MGEKKFVLKDSGERREFESGAVRDCSEGKGRFDLFSPFALMRIARVYEKGAKKYKDRNWEKGMPIGKYIDSAIRHIIQYMKGWEDEDHLAQAAWNLISIMHTEKTHPEMDDLPHYENGLEKIKAVDLKGGGRHG